MRLWEVGCPSGCERAGGAPDIALAEGHRRPKDERARVILLLEEGAELL